MRHARSAWLLMALFLAAANARAAAPEYSEDPFGDSDFANRPLIMNVNHPGRGRAEVAVLASGSFVDKYTAHMGGLVDASYHIVDTLALGVSVGYLHGRLTSIVTDQEGVLGNKMQACIGDPTQCSNINPHVPDFKQITGIADALLTWTPFYGKINVVSELDVNLELYGLAGVGINGTRTVRATAGSGRQNANDYMLSGGDMFSGGMFDNSKVNGTFGMGLRIFVSKHVALRTEVRTILFRDRFDFEKGKGEQPYTSAFWFGQAGLAYVF